MSPERHWLRVVFLLSLGMMIVSESPCTPLETVAWGAPVAGLRMGIALVQAQPTGRTNAVHDKMNSIKVVLENVSLTRKDLLLGASCGANPSYDLDFVITSSAQKSYKLLDMREAPCAGVRGPVQVRLGPGKSYTIVFPPAKLFVQEENALSPLTLFFEKGYTLSVSFQEKKEYFEDFDMGTMPPSRYAWMGRCKSGELFLKNSRF